MENKLFFIDNDALFYYFFRKNLYLLKPLIINVFNVKRKSIKKINLLNNKPYLDEVYNKYNVLYLQIQIFDKYVYLIINNIDNSECTKYLENYILNIELMRKYKCIYEQNKGDIRSVYFVFSKENWVKRIMIWEDNGLYVNNDFKFVFNINNKSSNILKDIRNILNIISITNESDIIKQGEKFKTKYNNIVKKIDNNILLESKMLKSKRTQLILKTVNFKKD